VAESPSNDSTSNLQETQELLGRIRDGDADACGALLERYRSRLEIFLRARLSAAARSLLETQDLVQEACIKTLPHVDRFQHRGIGSFWGYLRRIALNCVNDVYRQRAAMNGNCRLPQESWCAPAAPDSPPITGLLVREQFESFEKVLEKQTEKRRHALLMRLELGLDYQTIADECGFPTANAARMDVQRTIESVGKEMADHAG